MSNILEVKGLRKLFRRRGRMASQFGSFLYAVDKIDFEIKRGEFFGLMGNLYSGASIVGMLITGTLSCTSGEILFKGEDLVEKVEGGYEDIWRKGIFLTCSFFEYPFPLVSSSHPLKMSLSLESQRIKAIDKNNPELLVADTSLIPSHDTRKRILSFLMEKKQQGKNSLLLVTQDLGSIARVCNKIAVMYAGKIIEYAETKEFLKVPIHPYSRAALVYETFVEYSDVKSIGIDLISPLATALIDSRTRDMTINLSEPPPGCRFHPRCPMAVDICRYEEPRLIEVTKAHFVACHLVESVM